MAVRRWGGGTASIESASVEWGEDGRRACFICDDAPGTASGRSGWRSVVFHGRYVDEAGYEHPALVKVFREPSMFMREVGGLAMAHHVGIGPKVYGPEGLRWPDRDRFALPDGPLTSASLLICEEDVGTNLRVVLDRRAALLAGEPRVLGAAADWFAGLPEGDWGRLCTKVLFDLCVQVAALQQGTGAFSRPFAHGDIKPENVCVRFFGSDASETFDPQAVRATLIDFESLGPATHRDLSSRPATPCYRAYFARTPAPRVYDLGCVALLYRELTCGHLPAIEDFYDWETFADAPLGPVFWFAYANGAWCGFGNADELPALIDRLACELRLRHVDDVFPCVGDDGTGAHAVAKALLHGRVWMDKKDLIEMGSDLRMEYGDYYGKIAVAINACYDRAVHEGAWPMAPVSEQEDPALYAQNFDQARAWFNYLTKDLGLVVTRAGEERGRPVDQLTDGELAQLEILEHGRWLNVKRTQGWRPFTADDQARLAATLSAAELADPACVKRTLDGWKVNRLMRPWGELTEDEKYMTREMMKNLVPVLKDLGISVCRP